MTKIAIDQMTAESSRSARNSPPITDPSVAGTTVPDAIVLADKTGAGQVSVTFTSGGAYSVAGGESGTFAANIPLPGMVSLFPAQDPTNVALFIILDGDATVMNETATILLADATVSGGSQLADLVFNEIGLGSVTLRSTTP